MRNGNIVHCKCEQFDVYIGRPSKWGNPFVIGRDGTREEVITKYERWLKQQPELMQSLSELRGKILGCWCSPQACHGDVLVRLASAPQPPDPRRSCDLEMEEFLDTLDAREFCSSCNHQSQNRAASCCPKELA
jgi:hypothetical protein